MQVYRSLAGLPRDFDMVKVTTVSLGGMQPELTVQPGATPDWAGWSVPARYLTL